MKSLQAVQVDSDKQEVAAMQMRSQRKRLWRTLLRNRTAVVGMVTIVLIAFVAVFAPLIAPYDPYEQDPFNRLQAPSREHLAGTDDFGRDSLSRIIYGARVSLVVGLGATLLAMIFGTSLGLVAGYAGGGTENFIMRVVDVLMAFPSLLMGMMVLAVLQQFPGSGLTKAIFGIGVIMASGFARVVHAATLTLKDRDFVTAALSIGTGNSRILRRHILPNLVGEVVVLASLRTGQAIRVEASLSFIGLGVAPPIATWGNMIRDGMRHITYAPWLSVYPGLAILITILAFNLLGDGLRDVLDPKLQE